MGDSSETSVGTLYKTARGCTAQVGQLDKNALLACQEVRCGLTIRILIKQEESHFRNVFRLALRFTGTQYQKRSVFLSSVYFSSFCFVTCIYVGPFICTAMNYAGRRWLWWWPVKFPLNVMLFLTILNFLNTHFYSTPASPLPPPPYISLLRTFNERKHPLRQSAPFFF